MTQARVTMSMGEKVRTGVLTAALIALLGMVIDSRSELAVVRVEIRHLREAVNSGMSDRYRGSDARRDLAALDAKSTARDAIQQQEIVALRDKIETLEEHVGRLERERE